jgi:hypothetical protein
LVAKAGANDVAYTDPFLPDRAIVLRAARPQRYSERTPVLFVHHGIQRNGGDYRDYWLPLVDEAQLLVIVPEFSPGAFPGPEWYNYGNRVDAEGTRSRAANGRTGCRSACSRRCASRASRRCRATDHLATRRAGSSSTA